MYTYGTGMVKIRDRASTVVTNNARGGGHSPQSRLLQTILTLIRGRVVLHASALSYIRF